MNSLFLKGNNENKHFGEKYILPVTPPLGGKLGGTGPNEWY